MKWNNDYQEVINKVNELTGITLTYNSTDNTLELYSSANYKILNVKIPGHDPLCNVINNMTSIDSERNLRYRGRVRCPFLNHLGLLENEMLFDQERSTVK